MLKSPVFKGSCTALITPFSVNGIDYDRFKKNIEYQYENGTSAIVVCGTTGENATVSQEEHDNLIRVAVNHTLHRMKVIAGIGSNNTQKALINAENAYAVGADAVLMVTPYYNKSTQSGMIEHFTYVADRVDIPMILYNVPSRTGIGLTPETCLALSQHPNINGIKEASCDISFASKVRGLCGDALNVWSGNDDLTVPLMAIGAKGVISVASNIIPAVVAKICSLCMDNDFGSASELAGRFSPLISRLFLETNPIPVKAAMELLGTDSGILRLPLVKISKENGHKLAEILRESGLIN